MENILTEIEGFCVRHGLSEWQFGELAMGDKPFVKQLREGRDVRMSTVAKLRAFMASFEAGEAA